MVTRGQLRPVTLRREQGGWVSAHFRAINEFLGSNNPKPLEPFVLRAVRDVKGRIHPYETDPNTLRRLDSIGELHFLEIYADVAK